MVVEVVAAVAAIIVVTVGSPQRAFKPISNDV